MLRRYSPEGLPAPPSRRRARTTGRPRSTVVRSCAHRGHAGSKRPGRKRPATQAPSLPKLRARVRFSSPALLEAPGQRPGASALSGTRRARVLRPYDGFTAPGAAGRHRPAGSPRSPRFSPVGALGLPFPREPGGVRDTPQRPRTPESGGGGRDLAPGASVTSGRRGPCASVRPHARLGGRQSTEAMKSSILRFISSAWPIWVTDIPNLPGNVDDVHRKMRHQH